MRNCFTRHQDQTEKVSCDEECWLYSFTLKTEKK